jgi:hypothetical protein
MIFNHRLLQERKILVIEEEEELAPYQVPGDEQDEDGSSLDDREPLVAPLESYAEFHENKFHMLKGLCSNV